MVKGLGDMLKQAQQMQSRLAELQEEMAELKVEEESGGGMVTVVMNGHQDVLSLKIDPEVVNPDDVEMLEDLITAAVNKARKRVQEAAQEEMKKITGGISIPGLF
jgi:DNA-binding YbaB/EbfC family protein